MKKILTAWLALTLLVLMSVTAAAATNLLPNPGFDAVDDGKVSGWVEGVYNDTGVTSFCVAGGRTGGNAACIVSTGENDARYEKLVSVRPNTLYRISAYIKTEGVVGTGANLSALETWACSDYVTGDSDWRYVEFYGKTDADTKEVIVALRLGYYGGLTSGTAYFDDVTMEAVGSVPGGATAQSLANYNKKETKPETEKTEEQKKVDGYQMVKWATAIFIAGSVALYYFGVYSKKTAAQLGDPKAHRPRFTPALLIILAAGAVLRAWSFKEIPFYSTDFYSCFQGWATTVFEKGPAHFYASTFCDYPPLYILLLWPIGLLKSWLGFGTNSTGTAILLVTPAVIADVLGTLFVYRVGVKKLGERMGAIGAAAYFLNPAMWITSTGWGQIDSIVALAMVLMVYFLAEKKQLAAFVTFTLGMLLKPQMFFMGPILFFGTVNEYLTARRDPETHRVFLKKFFLNLAIALAAMIAVIFLFSFDFATFSFTQKATWIFEKFAGTIGQYNYLTLNAFNIYAFFGGNGVSATPLGMPYWLLSVIAILVIMVPMFLLNFKHKKKENLAVLAAFIVAAIFMLVPKMHERYLVVGVLLTLYAFLTTRDRRLLFVFFLMSVGVFVNVGLVLYSTWIMTTFNASLVDVLPNFIAAFNLAWFGYFCYVVYDICIRGRVVDFADGIPERIRAWKEAPAARLADEEGPARFNMKRPDWILVTVVTVLYAVISFLNLGTTNFPERMWKPSTLESAVGDLGESTYVRYLYYVGSIGEGKFTVSVSDDGENWTTKETVNYVNGSMYDWQYITVNASMRYVKVETKSVGFSLIELGAVDAEKNPRAFTLASATRTTGEKSAVCLFDEQSTVPSSPSYYNGMYFDEIYHARTGYEFANGLTTYETTHPPLGKVFIAWSIKLFGMNPFGWRFAGNVAGILMLPLIYLFAKQLFKKTWIAALALGFMTFDGMHFVQTRIATIDSFGVLFIILMYLFMYRYYTMNFYKQKLSRTLVPLGLCGLAFGLGAASKWICLYAGLGLAVIFFYTMYKRYDEYLMAKKALRSPDCPNRAQYQHVTAVFRKNLLITVGFCLIAFVAVPACIYVASYAYFVPYNKHYGYLRTVWENQKSMLSYHSGLTGDTHPYRSRWYTWPLMLRPMWYYLEPLSDAGLRGTIAAFGNPLVWWGGLVMTGMALRRAVVNRRCIDRPTLPGAENVSTAERRRFNSKIMFLLIAIGAQFIPWVFVPRSTFIYHYFATVPFLILFSAAAMDYLFGTHSDKEKKMRRVVVCLLVVAAVLGLLFYPMWSGVSVADQFVSAMKWLGSWVF
ncbi:MAG: glycosyltransferase family 39 protein [Eubacteriales bacterium]|nr:glycosyltransferase family 39 protein [Eubacteriales bacterium]